MSSTIFVVWLDLSSDFEGCSKQYDDWWKCARFRAA